MTGRPARRRTSLALPLLAVVLTVGCTPAARPSPTIAPTFAPTPPVKADAVIAGLKKALGPDRPMRFKDTGIVKIDRVSFKIVTEGDFQGGELDARLSLHLGALLISYDVMAVDGKTYVRPNGGKWRREKIKTPPAGSGPFGDMGDADLAFKGPSKNDRRFYTVVWKDPSNANRVINGTVLTSVKIKSSVITFQVRSNGDALQATYTMKGTGNFDGKSEAVTIEGLYTFFAVREPFVFKKPMK